MSSVKGYLFELKIRASKAVRLADVGGEFVSKLCAKTIELLKNRPRPQTYAIIGEKININPSWIDALAQGRIKEPGVQKIERLYEYLKGEPLKV